MRSTSKLTAAGLAAILSMTVATPAMCAPVPTERPTPAASPATGAPATPAQLDDYARREKAASTELANFTGGSAIVIGTTAAIVILAVVLLVVLL